MFKERESFHRRRHTPRRQRGLSTRNGEHRRLHEDGLTSPVRGTTCDVLFPRRTGYEPETRSQPSGTPGFRDQTRLRPPQRPKLGFGTCISHLSPPIPGLETQKTSGTKPLMRKGHTSEMNRMKVGPERPGDSFTKECIDRPSGKMNEKFPFCVFTRPFFVLANVPPIRRTATFIRGLLNPALRRFVPTTDRMSKHPRLSTK